MDAMLLSSSFYWSLAGSMIKARFLVTSLGVPQSMTLLNLFTSGSAEGCPGPSLLKPPIAALFWNGAFRLFLRASISLYLCVFFISYIVGLTSPSGRSGLISFSLGLFFMKETSFGLVLVGFSLAASSSFLNSMSVITYST